MFDLPDLQQKKTCESNLAKSIPRVPSNISDTKVAAKKITEDEEMLTSTFFKEMS